MPKFTAKNLGHLDASQEVYVLVSDSPGQVVEYSFTAPSSNQGDITIRFRDGRDDSASQIGSVLVVPAGSTVSDTVRVTEDYDGNTALFMVVEKDATLRSSVLTYEYLSDASVTYQTDREVDEGAVPLSPLSQSAAGLTGETELLIVSDFARLDDGWVDESAGGTTRAIASGRGSDGTYSPHMTVETTADTDTAQMVSQPFRVDASKSHRIAVRAKTLSGTVAQEVVLLCFSNGSTTSTGTVTAFTGWAPGASWEWKQIAINAVGGSAPAFPANTDRVAVLLKPTVGTTGKVAIDRVHIFQESHIPNNNIGAGSSGIHEAYYDDSNVYLSVYSAGYIAKMDPDGTYNGQSVPDSWDGQNDSHQLIVHDGFLYAAHFSGRTATKYDLSDRTKAAEVTLPHDGMGLVTDGTSLFVTTGDGQLHRIDLSTFSALDDSWNIGFSPSGTQATPVLLDGDIWINSSGDGNVYRVNKSDGTVVSTIAPPTGLASNRNYGFGASNSKAYLSFKNGTLVEYDPASNAISQTWDIGAAADSQIKYDLETGALWWAALEPQGDYSTALIRFDPKSGGVVRFPMRRLSGAKWCEIVGDEVWCGGLADSRIRRFVRI